KGAIRTAILYHHIHGEGIRPRGNSPYIGQDVFGSFSDDHFKYLSISDTNLIDGSNIEVTKTVRYNLVKKREDMPVILEAIKPGSNFSFSIDLKGNFDSRFDYFNPDGMKKILSMLNEFYLRGIEREIRELERNRTPDIYPIINIYHELRQDVLKMKQENNGAIIRIGAGKTFFENTIGIALANNDLKSMIARYNRRNEAKRDIENFPKTRTFELDGDRYSRVLGWIKIDL
ncbi:MAG: type III-A CRISPR-associated RAMP protein Csm5, partial [Tissierellia bacterium]|nr:type III-A CRISPR-associated RAMP protein Csm5 [Tissierellia bacterium]